MHADVPVRCIQKVFQIGEAELCVCRKSADYPEAHAFVNYLVKVVRNTLSRLFEPQ